MYITLIAVFAKLAPKVSLGWVLGASMTVKPHLYTVFAVWKQGMLFSRTAGGPGNYTFNFQSRYGYINIMLLW